MEKPSQQQTQTLVKDIITGTIVSGFIYLASIFLPLIGFLLSLLILLPTLLYRLKLGRVHGLIIPIIMIVSIIITGNNTLDIAFLAGLLLLGFIIGELIEAGFDIEKTMLLSCFAISLITVIGIVLFAFAFNIGPVVLISQYVAENLKLTMTLYKSMGMPQENIDLLSRSLSTIEYILIRICPALFISSTLFVSWINILGTKIFFAKKGITLKGYETLNQWKAPDFLVWTVIASIIMLFFSLPIIKIIGINGLIVLMTIYFFQGITIVSYFFRKKRFPLLIKVALYSIIVIQQLIMLFIIGLGFFDTWLNFRKLNHRPNEL